MGIGNVGAVVPGRNLVVDAFDHVLANVGNVGNVCTDTTPQRRPFWVTSQQTLGP